MLRCSLCRPHTCCHCGEKSWPSRCSWSELPKERGATLLPGCIARALSTALNPSCLEPSGLHCSDGKTPDGVSVVLWKGGKLLVWDATCPDMFAPSYSALASTKAGMVAAQMEERKRSQYLHLQATNHIFAPVMFWVLSPRPFFVNLASNFAATLHRHSEGKFGLYLGFFQPCSLK